MKEEYLPEIFDAFSRERNTTISRIQGTGLGLAITKRLVEMMQGTISVSSVLGEGTTFTVTIPMKFMTPAEGLISPETGELIESLSSADCADQKENNVATLAEQISKRSSESLGEISEIKRKILTNERVTPGVTIPLLLAEDNDLNAMIVTGLLEDKGFSITWVKDGKAAVDAMKAADPSTYALILMDAQMPVMGGHDAARMIRQA